MNLRGLFSGSLVLGCLTLLASPSKHVTFRVDMRFAENVEIVGIRGNTPPLSWEKSIVLSDLDGDSVYEVAIDFGEDTGEVIEYKFLTGAEKLTWELDGQNRLFIIPDEDVAEVSTIWNVNVFPDPAELPKIASRNLLAEVEIAEQAIRNVHPGLYRYLTTDEVDEMFAILRAEFSADRSYTEVYLAYASMLSKIKCGHTFANYLNQSELVKQVVFSQADKLPFTFRWLEGKIIVAENASGDPLLDSHPEITHINGFSSEEIRNELMKYIKADGSNDLKRIADLNLFGSGGFESFDVFFPLIYPPVNGEYEIEIQPASENSKSEKRKVRAISKEERYKLIKAKNPNFDAEATLPWEFKFIGAVGYLRLSSFDTFQFDFDWEAFLKETFSELKKNKTKDLILDIRWNEGGQDDVIYALGGYLAKEELSIADRSTRVKYQVLPDDLKPYCSSWTDEVFDLRKQNLVKEGSFYTLPHSPLEIKPNSRSFQGNIYMLVNAGNSSATFYLAEIVKSQKLGTLVGQTTGGSQKGLNGGQMFFVRLPKSGIEFDLPILGSFSEEKMDEGIIPDIEVLEKIDSFRQERDLVLNAVNAEISRKDP